METIHLTFRLLALSQGVFLLLYLLWFQRNRAGFLLAILVSAFCAYLAQPLVFYQLGRGPILQLLSVFATTIPALLWLVMSRFLNDTLIVPRWFICSTASYMALWYIGDLGLAGTGSEEFNDILFVLVPQVLKLVLVLHVIYFAIAGRDTDLLDNRFRLRMPLAIGSGIVVTLVIVVELWAGGSMPLIMESVGSIFMFLVAMLVNCTFFRLRDDLPFSLIEPTAEPESHATAPDPDGDTAIFIDRIEKTMTEGRFYATYSATLADLANKLNLPAYRLRKLINNHMGYRNFNQFLNHYRIEEAAIRLRQEQNLPVLTIALDVGFKSISSFNAAFKSVLGQTPTSYRSSQ